MESFEKFVINEKSGLEEAIKINSIKIIPDSNIGMSFPRNRPTFLGPSFCNFATKETIVASADQANMPENKTKIAITKKNTSVLSLTPNQAAMKKGTNKPAPFPSIPKLVVLRVSRIILLALTLKTKLLNFSTRDNYFFLFCTTQPSLAALFPN